MSEPCQPCQEVACPPDAYLAVYALTGVPPTPPVTVPPIPPPPPPPPPPPVFFNQPVQFCCDCP